jgi:hypothetical protein
VGGAWVGGVLTHSTLGAVEKSLSVWFCGVWCVSVCVCVCLCEIRASVSHCLKHLCVSEGFHSSR